MEKVLVLICLCGALLFAQGENAFRVLSLHELKSKDTVRQNYEESCGASALATVMGLFGHKRSEMEVLKELNATDMVSFAQLATTAKKFDFNAEGYKLSKADFGKLTIPVIAKVEKERNYPHFVVVSNHDGDFTSVFDPNYGRYTMSKNEFFDMWVEGEKGYILVVAPNEKEFVKPNIVLEMPNRNLFVR